MDNLPPRLKKLTSKCRIFTKWRRQGWGKSICAGRIGWRGWVLGGNCSQGEDWIVTQRRIENWCWLFQLSSIVFVFSRDCQKLKVCTLVDYSDVYYHEEKDEEGEKTDKPHSCHFQQSSTSTERRWTKKGSNCPTWLFTRPGLGLLCPPVCRPVSTNVRHGTISLL